MDIYIYVCIWTTRCVRDICSTRTDHMYRCVPVKAQNEIKNIQYRRSCTLNDGGGVIVLSLCLCIYEESSSHISARDRDPTATSSGLTNQSLWQYHLFQSTARYDHRKIKETSKKRKRNVNVSSGVSWRSEQGAVQIQQHRNAVTRSRLPLQVYSLPKYFGTLRLSYTSM